MSPRYHALDYLKILLVSGVVLAHAGLMSNHIPQWGYLVGNGLLRATVPTFALLTGAGLFHTMRRGRLRRWSAAMLSVYLIWCVIYAPIWLRDITGPAQLAQRLFFGPMHLWYLAAMLLATAILALVLHGAADAASGRRRVIATVLVTGLAGSFLQFAGFFGWLRLEVDDVRNGLFLIYPFAGLGYLLADWVERHGRDALPSAKVLWLGLAIVIALRLGEAMLDMAVFGTSLGTVPEFPPLAYGFSALLFLAFIRLEVPAPFVDLSTISAVTYLMHMGFILLLLHFGIRNPWLMFWGGLLLPMLIAVALPRLPWLGRRRAAPAPVPRKPE